MTSKEKIINVEDWLVNNDLGCDIWKKKYQYNNESVDDFIKRIYETLKFHTTARTFSTEEINEKINKYLMELTIVPGGSVLASAGTNQNTSLSNCFVVTSPSDSIDSILDTAKDISQIYKRRGGCGIDLSNLRPNGADVNNSAKTTSGPVSFMELYSSITNTIGQSGRRGALMLSIDVTHPDSLDFIKSKQDLTKITGANISVKVTDDFMKAVENDEDFLQQWPCDITIPQALLNINDLKYNDLNHFYDKNSNTKCYYKKIKAKELWDELIHCAWNTAEPGVLFWGTILNNDPASIYPKFKAVSTNPCFTGDTKVYVDDPRETVTIKTLADSGTTFKAISATFNGSWWNLESKLAVAFKTGVKDIIRVTFNNNTYIKCTNDHKLALSDGSYIEAKDSFGCEIYTSDGESLRVINIAYAGKDDVYDLSVQDNHNFFVKPNEKRNAKSDKFILVHNCGEIPLGSYDSCRLIAINLYNIVENKYTDKAYINFEKLKDVTRVAQMMADNLVDAELNAVSKLIELTSGDERLLWENIYAIGKEGRRTGVGFTGYGDMLAALGKPYGDPKTTEEVMKCMFITEFKTSVELADNFSSFPAYNDLLEFDKYNYFNQKWLTYPELQSVYDQMHKVGRRNISWSTCAPTGSISLLTGTSSGIEPQFALYYNRRRKCNPGETGDYTDQNGILFTTYTVIAKAFKEWMDITHQDTSLPIEELYKKSPWYKQCANDLDPIVRVNTQALIQKYITHSISSTCNLSNDTSEQTVNDIYIAAYKAGCKGITCYRDECRSGILIKADKKPTEQKPVQTLDSIYPKSRKKLGNKLYGTTTRCNTACGTLYITINKDADGNIVEIFTNASKSGTCKANLNGETRMASLALRSGVKVEEVIDQLKGIHCPACVMAKAKGKPLSGCSCPDIISKTLKDIYKDNSTEEQPVEILKDFEKCPECGAKLSHTSGCITCPECSWSKCS